MKLLTLIIINCLNSDTPMHVSSKVCYIRYAEPWSVGVAQHLTNTVFVDRALIVLPVNDGKIPDEASAMTLTNSGIGGINSGVVSQMVSLFDYLYVLSIKLFR